MSSRPSLLPAGLVALSTAPVAFGTATTGPAGAKAGVVWVPGEEGRRVASRWQREP